MQLFFNDGALQIILPIETYALQACSSNYLEKEVKLHRCVCGGGGLLPSVRSFFAFEIIMYRLINPTLFFCIHAVIF